MQAIATAIGTIASAIITAIAGSTKKKQTLMLFSNKS